MRPASLLLALLALSAGTAALDDGRACAQERRPAPAPGARADTTAVGDVRSDDAWRPERRFTIRRFGPGAGLDPARDDVEILAFEAAGQPPRRAAIGVRLGAADSAGIAVVAVTPDGPAARAGIAAGDRIVAVGGTSLRLAPGEDDDPLLARVPVRRLERAIAGRAPGAAVELRLRRDGRERTARVTTVAPGALRDLAAAPDAAAPDAAAPDAAAPDAAVPDAAAPWRGGARDAAELRRAADRMRAWRDSARAAAERRPALGLVLQATGSPRDTLGLLVARVTPGGPAERAGIVEGERVASVDGADVRVPRDEAGATAVGEARGARFTRELERKRPGDAVTLRLWGDGRWRTVEVRAGRASEVYPDRLVAVGPEGLLPGLPGLPRIAPFPPGAFREFDGTMPPVPPVPPIAPTPRVAPLPPGAPRIWLERAPGDRRRDLRLRVRQRSVDL